MLNGLSVEAKCLALVRMRLSRKLRRTQRLTTTTFACAVMSLAMREPTLDIASKRTVEAYAITFLWRFRFDPELDCGLMRWPLGPFIVTIAVAYNMLGVR
jgi:hypothetical protein